MRMERWFVAALALTLASCSPASVEGVAEEFFAECMSERDVPVENVRVVVRDGRHIESFDWDSAATEDVATVGDDCEEQTLRRFEISRS